MIALDTWAVGPGYYISRRWRLVEAYAADGSMLDGPAQGKLQFFHFVGVEHDHVVATDSEFQILVGVALVIFFERGKPEFGLEYLLVNVGL
jgi:hypothetical protein